MGNVNLITNPSFETNTTSWSFSGNSSVSRDSANVAPGSGTFCLKLTANGGAALIATYSATGLTIGQNYTLSFYTKTDPNGADFSVIPDAVNTGTLTTRPALRAGRWVRRWVGFKANATTISMKIKSEVNNTSGDIIYIDNVMLTTDGLMPYFDGDSPFGSWTGTAHASTSTSSIFAFDDVGSEPTTDEVVVIGGLCLNTAAFNITTKTGRYSTAPFRGDDYVTPGAPGKTFIKNKPLDSGLFAVSMFIGGCYPDGTIPFGPEQRALCKYNYEMILRQVMDASAMVPIYTWQPDGSVRTTNATLVGTEGTDVESFMGGKRLEVTFAFDILSGSFRDTVAYTTAGTAGTGWTDQTLSLPLLDGGTAPITNATVTVHGPITNPTVSCPDTGISTTYTGSVISTQSWVFDSDAYTSEVNGSSVLTNTTHSGSPKFLIIGPGNASNPPRVRLTGTGTGANTNLTVTANRRHLIG